MERGWQEVATVSEKDVLSTLDLSKNFDGLGVLRRVNVRIKQGECHAIIGPNGAGKTTLFNVISGKYRATSGRVVLDDMDITDLPRHAITRKGVARSFQITNLFSSLSVYENVRASVLSREGYRLSVFHRVSGLRKINEKVITILERTGLHEVRDVRADELSYGHQRKLEIAVALASDPRIVLLDEPTAGLDKEETAETVALIKKVTKGITIVLIEHDMEVVFSVADRITVLCDGQIVATDVPGNIKENPRVREAYLGSIEPAKGD